MSAPIIQIAPPPSKSDPQATFDADAEAMLDSLPQFVDSANAALVAIGLNHRSTSTSNVSMGVGTKNITVASGLGYMVGMYLNMTYVDDVTKHMQGTIASYNASTGALEIDVEESSSNSGSYANWAISVAVRPSSKPKLPFATTTGTASAYIANYGASVQEITDGAVFTAKFHTNCADNATFEVAGILPVLDIKVMRSDGAIVPIRSGDISGYAICQVIENGTSLLVEPSVEKATVTYLSTATTLTVETALDINLVLTATATHTLPLLSTFIEGGSFNVTANATATIQRQGSDVISLNGADVNSVTLKAGDNVDFVKSAGKWLVSGLNESIQIIAPITTTSGTVHTFNLTRPSPKRITVMFLGVSTNGTSTPILRLGVGGVAETTGYLGAGSTGTSVNNCSTGASLGGSHVASYVKHGSVVITRLGATNTYTMSGVLNHSDAAQFSTTGYSKALAGELDSLFLTTINGTDTTDAGTVGLLVEY